MVTGAHRGPLILLAGCVFTAICTEMLPVGLLPEIGRGLDVSSASAGLLVSMYAVLVAVMSVPIAAVAERWPRRLVLVGLLAAYALSNLCFAVAPDYVIALVARTIGGLAHAGFFAVAVAAAVSLVDSARSGRAVAVVMVGNALALVLGVPLGTVVGTALGWRWTFVGLAVAMTALAIAVLRTLPESPTAETDSGTPVLTAVRRPALLVIAAAIALLALGHFTLYTYIGPLLLHDGIGRSAVGAVLFAYGCGGLIGLAAAGAVVTRWPEQAYAADGALMATCLLLAAIVSSTIGIVAVVAVWGAAFGAFPTLSQTVTLRTAHDAPGTATALVNATTNIGIAGGALLGSRLLGVVALPALGWSGAAFVAASLAVYSFVRRGENRAPNAPVSATASHPNDPGCKQP